MARRRRKAAAKNKPTNDARASKNLGAGVNEDAALQYLQVVPLNTLDGIFECMTERLKEMGSGPDPDACRRAPIAANETPGTSMAGLLRFVKHSTVHGLPSLQCFQAVISKRMEESGYEPKTAVSAAQASFEGRARQRKRVRGA